MASKKPRKRAAPATVAATAVGGRKTLNPGERTVIRSIRMPVSMSAELTSEFGGSFYVRGCIMAAKAMKAAERRQHIKQMVGIAKGAGADL